MRIERLDLIAYGAFDGHSLDGLGEPGVHVVYGPNEAGKSTALSAFDQLLYGIDHHSRYAFRHGNRTRLGARLSAAGGVALEIVRRKKRKDDLVDGNGDPLGQGALAPFLGGVDRETFTTEFALNSDELRRGGRLLASGGGDMAQLLAAARSGLLLNAVLNKIDHRQGELFLPRGKRPAINALLDRLREVRKKESEAMLHPNQYWDAEHSAAEAERRLAETEADLRTAQRLRNARHHLLENLPALARLRELEEQVEQISAQGPVATDDIRAQLPELMNQRSERTGARSTHGGLLEETERQLAGMGQDEALLPHTAAIERLAKGIKAILDELDRRDSASGEASGRRARAASRLRTVHADATLADERLYRIPEALRGEGQELRDRGRTLRDDLTHARDAVKRCRDKHERIGKELSALPAGEDVSQLQNAYASIPTGLEEKLADTEADERKLDRRFRQARNRLDLPELTPEGVLELRLPDQERATRAERDFQDLEQRLRDRARELDDAQHRLATCRRDLDRLVSADAPPTHEELQARRGERDDLFARFLDDPSVLDSLSEAVRRADGTADLMLRHAERVNKRAELSREIADLEAAVHGHQTAVDEALAEQESGQRRWEALWEGHPAPAPDIGQASKTLDAFDRLQTSAQELQDVRIELQGRRERLNAHTARLRHLLRLGEDAPTAVDAAQDSAVFAEMVETARGRLDEHQRIAQDRAAVQRDLTTAETELEEAESAKADAEKALAVHDGRWQRFLSSASLAADRDFDAALTDLEDLSLVAADVDAAEAMEHKLQEGEQRISEFRVLLEETFGACGRDVPVSVAGWPDAIDTLAQDLQEQRDGAQQRKTLLANRASLVEQVAKADADLRGVESRLLEFSGRLGLSSIAELEAAAERASAFREKTTALANIRQTLPEGRELDRLREEAEETSTEELAEELEELNDRIEELETARATWLERRVERQGVLDGLDGGDAAARAEAEIAQICAGLADDAEEFLRLEAARIAINACMEEYRNSDQEPVLARAAAMFAQLTCGDYAGLEMSDEERPSIRAKTSAGTLLVPAALSEGTCDQLYLALRLATLERHAVAGNALPIVVDDLLMSFDEERTEAALRVLDSMADRFQVIVFTHHKHVVDGAVEELPAGRCHVHELHS
ncbi:AAA family ATPase [Spirillospora sp. NPDC029432]|uniref:ATP-binding protein n=1 Tax=Spirillospora sp. NPDC029432 TaxID=3154599 RepID=UPI0034542DDF